MKCSIQLVVTIVSITLAVSFVSAQTKKRRNPDQLKIAVQEICPVSGKQLGSMGTPTKVRIGEEELYLCCKGCTAGKIDKQHWTTIHHNFAKAQGKCPVMEKDLPKNAKWTIVNGQLIYICCPPCTKKIEANPGQYLARVNGYYQTSLHSAAPPASRPAVPETVGPSIHPDQLRITVQQICPVSGNQLDRLAPPIKVQAGGLNLYLCCEGCRQGKINKDHWATIHKNIATAQRLCPVMEKELPAGAKSMIVDGQLVFVCCPPCTEKIAKNPATFLGKIDSYYTAFLKQSVQGSKVQPR